ncbi:MAG: hypothetical protein AAGE01_08520 [Pseudomonadota bacterium]
MVEAIPLEAQALDPIPSPDQIEMQTSEMVSEANYYGLGFKTFRLPTEIHNRMLRQFRSCTADFRPEGAIDAIKTTQPQVIPALYFEDHAFNRSVLEELQPLHEAWCGMGLEQSACYGFRVYQRGSYLFNHVDRTRTHIISSTVCIDSDVDEPWPLYIADIEGNAFTVDMTPGDAVFYEGASLVHGRPWPLNGDWYAGMFVHYRPTGMARR